MKIEEKKTHTSHCFVFVGDELLERVLQLPAPHVFQGFATDSSDESNQSAAPTFQRALSMRQ